MSSQWPPPGAAGDDEPDGDAGSAGDRGHVFNPIFDPFIYGHAADATGSGGADTGGGAADAAGTGGASEPAGSADEPAGVGGASEPYGQGGAAEPPNVIWVAAGPNPCPDCIMNATMGPIPFGHNFYSGHISPPAHMHCNCYLQFFPRERTA